MNPTTKRIIWILICTIILAGILLLLWLWYLGKQQSQNQVISGINSGNGSINTSVPAGGQPSANSGGYAAQVSVGPSTEPSGNVTQSGTINTSGSNNGPYGTGNETYVYTIQQGDTLSSLAQENNTTVAAIEVANPNLAVNNLQEGQQINIPSTANSNQNISGGTTPGTGGGNTGGPVTSNPGTGPISTEGNNPATTTPAGAEWIPNTGAPFTPTAINSVNSSNPTGSGNIFNPTTSIPGGTGNNNGIAGLALGAVASAAACIPNLFGTNAAASAATAAAGAATAPIAVQVTNPALVSAAASTVGTNAQNVQLSFSSCITRGLARYALDQITASTVNWINSGFNGSPSFIQNYQLFLGNVANEAAGSYIQGSSLSFLCSPFALQVKIAVAQSYANQAAPSCTLSQISNNINGFMSGDFSAGGWPALLSFTTVPTNNPFGAYMYAQAGLTGAVSSAQQNALQNVSPEGFLNIQQVTCNGSTSYNVSGVGTTAAAATQSSSTGIACPTKPGCTCVTTTPGHVIASSLDNALNQPTDQLNAAQDFDQIISALMGQLTTKLISGGVSGLSGQSGVQSTVLTPNQQQAATAAQTLLTQMQSDTSIAEQYASLEQGIITTVQDAQGQLQTLTNCWISAATSTTVSSALQTEAGVNASTTEEQITSLQTQVDAANAAITQANSSIAMLDQLQSSVLNASSLSDVQNVQNNYTTAQSNGSILTTDDLASAQQEQAAVQSQIAALDETTSTELNQCYAFGNQTSQ